MRFPFPFVLAACAAIVAACSSSGGETPPASDAGTESSDLCPQGDIPKACPSPAPTWTNDVKAIYEAKCWPCHAGDGVEAQSKPLGTYAQAYADRSSELSQIYGCRMPEDPSPRLTAQERATVLAWFVCNAPQ